MESSVQCDFRREFPIFPLRQTVMFPHSVVPLHIFEPRYRQMLDDALDRVGQLVTATTHPDAEEERPGEPSPLLPVGCIGQIVDHERLPDGRYNILLQGLCRVEIEELNEATDERLYRLGRLSPMVDTEAAQHDRPEARDLIRIALQGDANQVSRFGTIVLGSFSINHGAQATQAIQSFVCRFVQFFNFHSAEALQKNVVASVGQSFVVHDLADTAHR